ncbi:unnamed protein product [Adineta ricciae]|uniref:Uncharacterized protein n=1 Tax=Adineta ricciae TaxID=249248 RepID=A0A814YN53_ADIRI|nr:unnamed protein product [Adineta ricciae]CAF1403189.1 unnamed protein product [Adineta ricciae]
MLYGLNHVYLSSSSATFCKLLIYLPHIGLQMTRIFLILACFDRYALSSPSVTIRNFSQVSVARRTVPIVIVIVSLAIPILMLFLSILTFYNLKNRRNQRRQLRQRPLDKQAKKRPEGYVCLDDYIVNIQRRIHCGKTNFPENAIPHPIKIQEKICVIKRRESDASL